MRFETKLNGIPCICNVLTHIPYIHMRITGTGFGDAEPPEEEYIEFEILDRKGYQAPWLEKYLTSKEEERILTEFREYLTEDIYYRT